MPDFLRAYGDMLQRDSEGASEVFVAIVGVVLLFLLTVILGAAFQGAGRSWKRAHGARWRESPRKMSEGRGRRL
jgi:hypothetical protein